MIACLALGVGSARAQGGGGTIGVAWDLQGLVCERSVAAGTDGTFYILGYLTGAMSGGTTGAEFRVAGLPSDWYVISSTPNPAAILSIGDPLAQGCNIAFPDCQVGASGVVLFHHDTLLRHQPGGAAGSVGREPHHTEPAPAPLPAHDHLRCALLLFHLLRRGNRSHQLPGLLHGRSRIALVVRGAVAVPMTARPASGRVQ